MNDQITFRGALRARLLLSLGLASTLGVAACGDGASSGSGGGDASGGAGGSGGGTTSAGGSTTSAGGGTTSAGGSTATDATTSTTTTTTTGTTTATPVELDVERCFAITPGTACPAVADAAGYFGSCTTNSELVTTWLSGPTETAEGCCYQVDVTAPNDPSCGIAGRPFVVEGQLRVAPLARGARGWERPAPLETRASAKAERAPDAARAALQPQLTALDPATRAHLGEQWARDAAFEHASVASFGKLALELLAFGAPAALVRATHEAALEEVGHAEMGFALATTYLGRPVGPGPLPEARVVTGASSLAELATAALSEGCFGETVAAVVASAQRDAARDPAVRDVLALIADEEARHAELAFRIVAWAIASGGEPVRAAVHDAFLVALEAARAPARASLDEAPNAPTLRHHGRLGAAEQAREQRRAIDEVVVPTVARLLGMS